MATRNRPDYIEYVLVMRQRPCAAGFPRARLVNLALCTMPATGEVERRSLGARRSAFAFAV